MTTGIRALGRWIIVAALLAGQLAACAGPGPEPTPAAAPSSAPARAEPTATVGPAPTITAAPSRTLAPSPPDLTPPPGGWIAFTDPSDHLVLTSMDGSRRVTLSEPGRSATWSPDGRWLQGTTTTGSLALLSLPDGRTVTVADKPWVSGVWSQDSRCLAYVRQHIDSVPWRYELGLYEIASGRTITVTHEARKFSEWGRLCGPPFPYGFLGVFDQSETVVRIYNRQGWELAVEFSVDDSPEPNSGRRFDSMLLWLPDGEGVVYAKQEFDMKSIILAKCPPGVGCTGRMVAWPLSLAVWRAGDSAPRTVLKAEERRRYWPEGWLPDGRLEVRQMDWERDEYEGSRAQAPERVQYRYFRMDAEGELQEVEGSNLPWWAGGEFIASLARQEMPPGNVNSFDVSPDGRSVVFDWRRVEQKKEHRSVFVWNGAGAPVLLGSGSVPKWQPNPAPGSVAGIGCATCR